jgi:hypothetical protein
MRLELRKLGLKMQELLAKSVRRDGTAPLKVFTTSTPSSALLGPTLLLAQ